MTDKKNQTLVVDYASDLHLGFWAEFHNNQLKFEKRTREFAQKLLEQNQQNRGDVLVLAGDFGEQNTQNVWFLEECSKYYKHVVATMGNHDYYLLTTNQKRKYKNSFGRETEMLDYFEAYNQTHDNNVHFVVNQILELNNFTVAVTPLWYNVKSEAQRHAFHAQSNDSKYVHTTGYDNWVDLHARDAAFYQNLDHVDLLVTHVPPVHAPKNVYPPADFYYTNVDALKADHWVCGHQHVSDTFEKAGTKFYMNPLGYKNELYSDFNGPNPPRLQQFTLTK